MLLEHLTKASVHAHLMKQGHDYYGVEGDMSDLGSGNAEENDIEEAYNIVSSFGAVMEEYDYAMTFYDVKILPFEKDTILNSLITCYKVENDDNSKEMIKVGLLALTHFQKAIGENPIETMPDITSFTGTGDMSTKQDDKLTDEEMEETKVFARKFLERSEAIDEQRVSDLNAIADAEYKMYLNKIVD